MEKKTCRKRKFAAATSNNNNDNGSKRDALADLTNSLIPTEVLLDLCSNSIATSKAHDLLRRSQTSTFPISNNLQNSKCDSKSDTSIGSSNFDNFRDAQNPTPVRRQLSNSSSGYQSNEGRKLAVYSRRQTVENSDRPRKSDSVLVSSTRVKKTKDEGKGTSIHFSTTPSYKAKSKQKAFVVRLDLIPSEKETAKEKAIAVPWSSTSDEKLKDNVKATALSRSSMPVEKLKDKGKGTAVTFSFTPAEKGKNKGKAVAMPFSHLNEQAEDKEKSTAMLINCPLNKRKERNIVRAAVSSCPPLHRARSTRDKLNQTDDVKPSRAWSDPHPKRKKRRCSEQQSISDYSLSQEFEKQKAYFQEIDAFELPVEEVSGSDLD